MEKYIGKVLNDRYMITEVVGVGGMAYVFKAFDKVCNRVVAVKILKDEFMSDAQFRRRFTNESKAITMLSHSNIVDVYDVSLEGDTLYIVMEFIDGITLKEYMEKKGVLTPNEALHFLKQILAGLSHAHERGIVHRDIKPHNIVLLKDGTIKITDFGIARLTKFDTQTISDMAIGSVHYISPEQASGDRTDERSDIYSVGIILYEMLTAKLPFEADSAVAVALMQVQSQPDLPTEINPEIPQGLEDITLKAIMKDPAIRYQTTGAILADIAQFEEDPTITFNYSANAEEEPINLDNSPTINAVSLSDFAESDVNDIPEEEEGLFDDFEEDEEEENKFKSNWLPIIAGVGSAILIIGLILLGIIFQKEIFGGNKMTCPDVVGMTVEDAKEEHNLKFVVSSTVPNDEYKAGTIISQTPEAGEEMKKKEKIKVVVSSGPENDEDASSGDDKQVVPDVSDKDQESAKKIFEDAEIPYQFVDRDSDTVEKGCVISTDPVAGEEVPEDKAVLIYISTGPKEAATVIVPNLVGLSLENAKTMLSNNRLKTGVVTKAYSDTVAAGNVISQSIPKNDKVEEDTAIDLVVSLGKEPAKAVSMPNLCTLSLEVAKSTLSASGLKLGTVTQEYNDYIPQGAVISQSVAANTSVLEGTAINLVISLGKNNTSEDGSGNDNGTGNENGGDDVPADGNGGNSDVSGDGGNSNGEPGASDGAQNGGGNDTAAGSNNSSSESGGGTVANG